MEPRNTQRALQDYSSFNHRVQEDLSCPFQGSAAGVYLACACSQPGVDPGSVWILHECVVNVQSTQAWVITSTALLAAAEQKLCTQGYGQVRVGEEWHSGLLAQSSGFKSNRNMCESASVLYTELWKSANPATVKTNISHSDRDIPIPTSPKVIKLSRGRTV